MTRSIFLLSIMIFAMACAPKDDHVGKMIANSNKSEASIQLDFEQAERLAKLPLDCIGQPFPYKAGSTLAKADDLQLPQTQHPAFYGCFDWHSAVHGHWSLIYLMKRFPNLSNQTAIRQAISNNLTKENIQKEIEYFSLNKYTQSFERTYGWAWLLKLQEELDTWDDPNAKSWAQNLKPLSDLIVQKYIEYLPKLVYPIRVGEHTNTAFGLSFAYDYAQRSSPSLQKLIEEKAWQFYGADVGCPIGWEPSGYDFLSPCLQEIDIMRKVCSAEKFQDWLKSFMPGLMDATLTLETGKVIDRSDGKLVHLDGLNFSRAWCLYPLSNQYSSCQKLADDHLSFSLSKIVDGDYAGQHWLASFALYAFKELEKVNAAK